MSSRTASRRKRTSIWGTKPSTAPTPAMIPSRISPWSQSAQPMAARKLPTALGTQSPKSTSLAQSVPMVPMEMVQPPMAMAYTRNMTTAKRGSASTRLVTMRSILSEVVIPVRFFFTLDLTTLEMYS